ncbi:DNA polymerase-1 [Bacilli bacterium PM5-3]|nr:DNA polymerase-1 [Bacilli bacterium PM5-3]
MKKIIAIDGNALLFAAYHATKDYVKPNSKGEYTNALDTFIRMINKIRRNNHFDYIMVAFDASSKTFRSDQFEDYKGTRDKTDDALVKQFPLVREYLNYAGIANYEVVGYEADDILGTLAKLGTKDNYQVDIITADKDLLQLVNENVNILLKRRNSPDPVRISLVDGKLSDIWDIKPLQVIDLKALWGDPSDNIPGVNGIGEKGAIKLLDDYDNIENIYNNLSDFKGKRLENLTNDKDKAFMSKELATIITDVKLPFKIDDLIINDPDISKLKNLYHEHELNKLLADLQDDVQIKAKVVCDFSFEMVNELSSDMLLENSFVDLISLSEYYHKDKLLGMALINEKGNYFISTKDILKSNEVLDFLKNETKYTYDLKKNILIGHWHGIEVANFTEDIMIGSYLIDSNTVLDANALVDTNFNISTMSNKDLLKQDKEVQIETKVKQAYYLNKLISRNIEQIEKLEIVKLYDLELKVAKILSDMEKVGILLDKDKLNEINVEYQTTCDKLEQDIYEYAKKEFNVNSTKQLAEVLFEDLNLRVIKKTKTGYSTDNDVLSALYDDHPIIPLIIEYRTYKKLLSTYIIPMPEFVLNDNRIHTIYNQCLTATGRLSSKEPNLQNIATRSEIQRSIKKSFVAKEGYSLVSFDYSQIELRILASFSHDPAFIKAFKEGMDIHRHTAASVAGISEDEVTPEQRKAAKAINFGIVYGISDFGLAKQLGINRNDAKDFIDLYYKTYPSIKEYLDGLVKSTQESGYAKTILNRIRYINEIKSNNFNIREMGKRMAMNTPIQGSAADILKIAMVNVSEMLKSCQYDITLLLQVHDELIFEVKDEDVKSIIPLIEDAMNDAYQMEVKIEAHYSIGKTWYDL